MAFLRTQSGLSNLHLFYDADLIIFTEGGSETFTLDEIEDGRHSKSSVDIKFWKYVLDVNNFDKKVEFRAIGSKSASISICEQIINDEVSNVAVARDRDLDDQLGVIFVSPYILYTKGYSWENDVFVKDLTYEQVESMLLMAEIPEEVNSIVNDAYNDFGRIGKHLAKLEIIFRKNGIRFISDFNSERFFNSKRSACIDKRQVFLVLNEKKMQIKRPVNTPNFSNKICPFLNNYGKMLEALSITIIVYICKKYGGLKSIPKDMIITSMIERFAQKLKRSRDNYYLELVSKLRAACLIR